MIQKAEEIVESIIEITCQRSQDSLEQSLLETLVELLGAEEIAFNRLPDVHHSSAPREMMRVRRKRGEVVALPGSDLEPKDLALLRCLESGERQPGGDGEADCHYPVHFNGRVVGVLSIRGAQLDNSIEPLVRGLLRIYENYLTLIDDSERDTLTGLLNRKTFEQRIAGVIERSSRNEGESPTGSERRGDDSGRSHWLAVLDIDHFKRINDSYGHLYGDEVLLLLARIMRHAFRSSDLLFRYGGEEFVVVLAPTAEENAMNVLNRFREKVGEYDFPQVGQVTVSIGVVEIDGQTLPSQVVGHADQALYYAKEHGRDRVCHYRTLVERGELALERSSDDVELF